MSILDPTYNGDLHFSDLVRIDGSRCMWNPVYFDIRKLSKLQSESHMIDGTFEDIFSQLNVMRYEETSTVLDTMGHLLYNTIAPYLIESDVMSGRVRHIYVPNMSVHQDKYIFNIWDDIQREYPFQMAFYFND